MNQNTSYIAQAKEQIKRFESEKEPERLREASLTLQNVQVEIETDVLTKAEIRLACLNNWLSILQLLDFHIDPRFNPDEIMPLQILPPRTKSGDQLPPGADPKLIDDPQARANYQKQVEENRQKQENYNIQLQLNELKDYIPACIKKFITGNYTVSETDRLELKTMIEKQIKNAERKSELLKFIAH